MQDRTMWGSDRAILREDGGIYYLRVYRKNKDTPEETHSNRNRQILIDYFWDHIKPRKGNEKMNLVDECY